MTDLIDFNGLYWQPFWVWCFLKSWFLIGWYIESKYTVNMLIKGSNGQTICNLVILLHWYISKTQCERLNVCSSSCVKMVSIPHLFSSIPCLVGFVMGQQTLWLPNQPSFFFKKQHHRQQSLPPCCISWFLFLIMTGWSCLKIRSCINIFIIK